MKKTLKEIMSLSFPFCRHGSSSEEIVNLFRKINNSAHEAELLINGKEANDHKLNNPKGQDN